MFFSYNIPLSHGVCYLSASHLVGISVFSPRIWVLFPQIEIRVLDDRRTLYFSDSIATILSWQVHKMNKEEKCFIGIYMNINELKVDML